MRASRREAAGPLEGLGVLARPTGGPENQDARNPYDEAGDDSPWATVAAGNRPPRGRAADKSASDHEPAEPPECPAIGRARSLRGAGDRLAISRDEVAAVGDDAVAAGAAGDAVAGEAVAREDQVVPGADVEAA